jgi:microcystin-dependent protein
MPFAERHRAVTTAILQRAQVSAHGAEQDDGFAEECPSEALARLQVSGEGGDVPHVSQEHG